MATAIDMTTARTRTESDSMGTIEVPANVYWGAQTQRSLAALQHRPRHHAAGADPRLRHPEEGLRAGQPGPGQAARRQGQADRAGRRRGHLRQAERPVPAAHMADRQRHANQHERERGHLQPRHRTGRRRDGIEEAHPSQRSRQHVAVVERHLPRGHAHRGGGAGGAGTDPRHPNGARRHRRQGEAVRRRREDRPHPPAGRRPAHPRAGVRRLGQPAGARHRAAEAGARRALRPGHRRDGRGHRA